MLCPASYGKTEVTPLYESGLQSSSKSKFFRNLLIFSIMPTYISLLRGINVGGHKRVKMDLLRKSFEGLGFDQVKTYIQSGNVVFSGRKLSTAALSSKIEAKILADFGFSVSVSSRTQGELEQTI